MTGVGRHTSGSPTTGTPTTGIPTSGTPATGTPATGTPATGTPTSGRRVPRVRTLLLSVGVTTTLVAWGVLVAAAIDFGHQARSGEHDAWTFLAVATAGAVACLFLTLLLGARLVGVVRGREPSPPPRGPRVRGGHRAAR